MQRKIGLPLVALGGPVIVQVSGFDLVGAAGGLGVRPFRYEGRHVRREEPEAEQSRSPQ